MSLATRLARNGVAGWLLPAAIIAGWEAAARAGLI
ncbi:ABC transporter permease, partial [Mesorhizobium sp. M2A.F.Ca.ET.046.02.1.1]